MSREFEALFAELGVDLDYSHETDAVLAAELDRIKWALAALAGAAKNVQAEISSRWAEKVAEKYAQMKKEGGAVSIRQPDGLTVKAISSKKVEWDETQLRGLASQMDQPQFDHYFKFSISVPEKVYASCSPNIKEEFDKARTVKWGEPKITLEVKE